jgi:hypothetical protein
MLTLVALVVRQFSTTDWPTSMASGSAERVAVGAGAVTVGAVSAGGGGGAVFFWQPVAVTRTSVTLSRARFHRIFGLDFIPDCLQIERGSNAANVRC